MMARTGFLLAAILALSAANAQATLIDSFDAKSQSYWAGPLHPQASGQVRPGSDTAIGGYRDVAVQWLSGGRSYLDVSGEQEQPGLSFTQTTGQAIATLTWDGANSHNGEATRWPPISRWAGTETSCLTSLT